MEKENKKENGYGFLTVGYGTGQERKLEIVDYILLDFPDERKITVAELKPEEGEQKSYLLQIANSKETGRPDNKMWLSETSFLGLMSAAILFMGSKGLDLDATIEKLGLAEINYSGSNKVVNSIETERKKKI